MRKHRTHGHRQIPGQFLLQRTAAVLAAQRGGQRVELALRGGLGVEVAIEVEGIGRAHVDRTTDRIARHVRGGRFGHLTDWMPNGASMFNEIARVEESVSGMPTPLSV